MRRKFLGREIIERPRQGSSNPSAKARHFGKIVEGEYYGPTRLPMSMGGKALAYQPKGSAFDKSFSDVLGPLYGFLRKNCGRPWDKVYSELKQKLGGFSWPLQHILTAHLDVETHTFMGNDGHVWSATRYGGGFTRVDAPSFLAHEFYVDPRNGILRETPVRRRRGAVLERHEVDRLHIKDDLYYVKINGLWYTGRYRHSPFVCVASEKRWSTTLEPFEWPNFQIRWGKDSGAHILLDRRSCGRVALKEIQSRLADLPNLRKKGRKRGR